MSEYPTILTTHPEVEPFREVARCALMRAMLHFEFTHDLEEGSRTLGLALYKSCLRNHPHTLDFIAATYGMEAHTRAWKYCEQTRFPKGMPPVPRVRRSYTEQHRTSPEVRALWGICREAVEAVFTGLTPETHKKLVLALSWKLHITVYQMWWRYRETIDELRRIRRTRRVVA